jgi:7-keto-8-aminopelargonate synthetase-like enzyme
MTQLLLIINQEFTTMETQNNELTTFLMQIGVKLKKAGLIHLTLDDEPMPDRRLLHYQGNSLINFTSCNYVGLETDERLKAAAIEGIHRYGVQYYCVRTYTSLHPYEELENMMKQIFGHPSVVMPTTMLGHMSCLPTIVTDKDAVILDHQVHTSVAMSAKVLKASGVYVEKVRHNRMDYLESRIQKLKGQYRKIWYLADGVYSMFGNLAPFKVLYDLLNKYEQFNLYIDDSHGMSWTGKHGAGTVLDTIPFHERMVLVTSLGKAFGATGGVAVFHDQATREMVRALGKPLIFTGPIQPPTLCAAVASAKIHLSDEITDLQAQLKQKIRYFEQKAASLNLPMVSKDGTPIFFMGIGDFDVAVNLVKGLMASGFFACLACYPGVPIENTGIRFLLTIHHTEKDIDGVLERAAELLPQVLEEGNYSMEKIHAAFEMYQNPVGALDAV